MGTSFRIGIGYTLAVLSVCFLSAYSESSMSLEGIYLCKERPDNMFAMELRVTDVNGLAVRLEAVNDVKQAITTCDVSGSGTASDPFHVETLLSTSTNVQVDNLCGVRVTPLGGNRYNYEWMFKSFTYTIPNPQGTFEQGVVIRPHCTTDDIAGELVATRVLPSTDTLRFSATNTDDITGLNKFAEDAELEMYAYLYPNDDYVNPQLAGAKGFYLTSCYSATNPTMTQHREQFINAVGCGVQGADYKPSGEMIQISGDDPFILRARFTNAKKVQNKKTIYFECSVSVCGTACPQMRCGGSAGVDTGIVYSTSFTVQDLDAQTLAITKTTSGPPVVEQTVQEGDIIYLHTTHVPDGVDGNTEMLDAMGFYVYTCYYSTDKDFKTKTKFVNDLGCVIAGTDFTPSSEFIQVTSYFFGNAYIVKSGPFVAKKQNKHRTYITCNTGKCKSKDHPYCTKRCGANGAVAGTYANLGFIGMETSITITDKTAPSILFQVQDDLGRLVNTLGINAFVNEPLEVKISIDPEANDAPGELKDALGAFVFSCYGAELEEGEKIEDVPVNRRSYFINALGCVNKNSQYAPDDECKLESMSNVSPFEINCGKIQVARVANIGVKCESGYCLTSDNLICDKRCGHGALTANSFAIEADIPLTTEFLVQERDLRRTAVRSNEIVTIITVLCTLIPILVVIVIIIGTAVLVWKQRRRVKEDRDDRSYDYDH